MHLWRTSRRALEHVFVEPLSTSATVVSSYIGKLKRIDEIEFCIALAYSSCRYIRVVGTLKLRVIFVIHNCIHSLLKRTRK